MSGKNFGWHHGWHRELPAVVMHISGLKINMMSEGEFVDNPSIAKFMDYERARGVPDHQMLNRLTRLMREARQWHQQNP